MAISFGDLKLLGSGGKQWSEPGKLSDTKTNYMEVRDKSTVLL